MRWLPLCLLLCVALRLCPEAMAGPLNEDIFKARLRYRHAFDDSGECFHHIGDKFVSLIAFQADTVSEDGWQDDETIGDLLRKLRGVRFARSFKGNDISADLGLQFEGRSESDKLSFIQDCEAVAVFSFFHQVRSDEYRHTLFIAACADTAIHHGARRDQVR